MIYSIMQHRNVPVTIEKKSQYIDDTTNEVMTRYDVYKKSKKMDYVGYVDLIDTKRGVKVLYIKNQNPNLYKHFGQLADMIEVEHCLKRGIEFPKIESVAARGTYIKHFKRGKRFENEGINIYLDSIFKRMQKGEQIITEFLGYQKMYMPMSMINKLKDKIQIHQLLKGVK